MSQSAQGASALAVFNFQSHEVRTVIREGEPWFVAADVCAALEINNPTMALRRLDDDEQALISIEGINRGNDKVNVVNESGLYALVLRSRKPEARKFAKWVTAEVLPSIRKTGRYDSKDQKPDLSNTRWLLSIDENCNKTISLITDSMLMLDVCDYETTQECIQKIDHDNLHLLICHLTNQMFFRVRRLEKAGKSKKKLLN